VTELRHDIANLKRIVFPLSGWSTSSNGRCERWRTRVADLYFGDLGDEVDRVWSVLEECRDTIDIYKDTDYIISSDRTNRNPGAADHHLHALDPGNGPGHVLWDERPMPGGQHAPWTFWGP